jgi:hypothetical protein
MSTDNKQDSEDRGTKEKRTHTRHDCHEPTFYSTKDGLYEGIIRNRDKEGDKGIFIATSEDLAFGEVVTVAISSPGETEMKKIRGMIARKEPGGYAVQFTSRLNE